MYIFLTQMEQSIAKRSQTQSALGGGPNEGGGLGLHSKFLGLVYGCNFFLCNSFRNPKNKNVSINIFHDF
jgi:hypothetical protein